ncbi:hypothetical protein CK203_035477 [Vitis vinifera]|uniref:Uncharacterized protein n=1 Tax=Vitis vinifera TaxID=29760 RepID=A0A438I3M0_VITVI|nr:hypothetical protein CK203_035477 [Vitis vinifera]
MRGDPFSAMKKLHGQVAKSTACPWWWARMTQWRKSWVRMTQWRNGAHESSKRGKGGEQSGWPRNFWLEENIQKLHGQVAKSTARPWWWVRMTHWRNGAHESRRGKGGE